MESSLTVTGEALRQRCREFDTVHDDAVDYFGGGFATFQNDFDSVIFASHDGDGHPPKQPDDTGSLLSEPSIAAAGTAPATTHGVHRPPRSPLPPSQYMNFYRSSDLTPTDNDYHFLSDRDNGVIDLPFMPDPLKQSIAAAAHSSVTLDEQSNIQTHHRSGKHRHEKDRALSHHHESREHDPARSPLRYRQAQQLGRTVSTPEPSFGRSSRERDFSSPKSVHPSPVSSHIVIDDLDEEEEEEDIDDEDPASASSASRPVVHGGSVSPLPAPPHLDSIQVQDPMPQNIRATADTFMSSSSANTTVTPGSPPQPSSPSFASSHLRPIHYKRSSLPTQPTYYSDIERDRDRAESSASTGYASSANFPPHSYSASAAMSATSGSSLDAHPIDWAAARSAYILKPSSERVRFEQFAVGLAKYTVFVFVTQKTVEVSALVYGRVAHLLHQAGARIVFVSPWSPKQASDFLSQFERINPFPGTLLCDPDASLYAAFGFKRGALASLIPTMGKPLRHGVRNAVNAASYRAAHRELSNTHTRAARIKTGAVVLANAKHQGDIPGLVLRLEEAADTGPGCYLDVLPICGVHGAFIPDLDVSHVISRFQNMRANLAKTLREEERENQGKRVGESKGRRNMLGR